MQPSSEGATLAAMAASRSRLFLAGVLASGPALLILVLGRLVSDRPGLIEAISDGFNRYLPLDVFEALVSTLGPLAKGSLTLGIAAGIVLAGGLLGWLALDLTRRQAGATSRATR